MRSDNNRNIKEKDEYIKNYTERKLQHNIKLDNFYIGNKGSVKINEINFNQNQKLIKILNDNDLFEKIIKLLKCFTNIDTAQIIESFKNTKESKGIQTEVKYKTLDYYENQNYSLELQISELKKTNEIIKFEYQTKIENLNERLKKYEEDNLYDKYEILIKDNENVIKELDLTKDRLNKTQNELENKYEYIELIEESIRSNNNQNFDLVDKDEEIPKKNVLIQNKQNILPQLIYINLLYEITKYLEPIETFNLKHSDRNLFTHIENNSLILKQIFYYTIKKKNRSIEDLSINYYSEHFNDMENEYLNKDIQIDYLIKKYNPINENKDEKTEINRKELGNTIFKSIDYIHYDVNYFLNNQENICKDPKIKANKSLIGSFGGYMNKVVNNMFNQEINSDSNIHSNLYLNHNANKNNYNIYNSFDSTKINTSSRKNSVISIIEQQFLNFNKKESNFNFNSPLEIKFLIYSCFFKLGESNNISNLKSYMEEISNLYAKLLFFSIEIMVELSEIRILKNCLFNYFIKLKEEKRLLIIDNCELVRQANSLNYINGLLHQERNELREKLVICYYGIDKYKNNEIKLKSDFEIITEKYKKIENEYFEIKCFYKKENANLIIDLESIIIERDKSVAMLIKINEFFYDGGVSKCWSTKY